MRHSLDWAIKNYALSQCDHLAMKVSGNCVYIINSTLVKCIPNSQVDYKTLQLTPGGKCFNALDIVLKVYPVC